MKIKQLALTLSMAAILPLATTAFADKSDDLVKALKR